MAKTADDCARLFDVLTGTSLAPMKAPSGWRIFVFDSAAYLAFDTSFNSRVAFSFRMSGAVHAKGPACTEYLHAVADFRSLV
jgi:hypothetical protein